jgi:uncharacterized protein with ATP-grasp and redox domains
MTVLRMECIPCLIRQAHEAVVAATSRTRLRETGLRDVLKFLSEADWHLPPPALAQQIHRLILAKGQGNYESLVGLDKHMFFLFKVKCDVVGDAVDCSRGSLVIVHQRPGDSESGTATESGATVATGLRAQSRPAQG